MGVYEGMASVTVVVTVDAAADLEAVKAECQNLGLAGIIVLPHIGLVTGVIEAASMNELAKIPGVRAVELERKIIVRPPRSAR